jgi:hypothetical protein
MVDHKRLYLSRWIDFGRGLEVLEAQHEVFEGVCNAFVTYIKDKKASQKLEFSS